MKVSKKRVRIFIGVVVFLMLLATAASTFLAFNAKKIILAEIEKNTGLRAQAESLRVNFPSTIEIRSLLVGDNIRFERLLVSPSLLGLLKRSVILSVVVVRPQLTVIRKADGSFDFGISMPQKIQDVPTEGALEPKAKKEDQGAGQAPVEILVSSVRIDNGQIDFIDRAISAQTPFEMSLKDIGLSARSASVLNPYHLNLKGSGNFVSHAGQELGAFDLSGWVDPEQLDMDAKISLDKINLAGLSVYGLQYLKRQIQSGDLEFAADLKSEKNDLTAVCHVQMSGVSFQSLAQEGQEKPGIGDLTLLAIDSALSADGKIVFDFAVRTKMDQPRFENIKFKGSFFQSKVNTVLSKPPDETIQDLKKIGKDFEAIGKQFKDIFKK